MLGIPIYIAAMKSLLIIDHKMHEFFSLDKRGFGFRCSRMLRHGRRTHAMRFTDAPARLLPDRHLLPLHERHLVGTNLCGAENSWLGVAIDCRLLGAVLNHLDAAMPEGQRADPVCEEIPLVVECAQASLANLNSKHAFKHIYFLISYKF